MEPTISKVKKKNGKLKLSLFIAFDKNFVSLEKKHFQKLGRFYSAIQSSIIMNIGSINMKF